MKDYESLLNHRRDTLEDKNTKEFFDEIIKPLFKELYTYTEDLYKDLENQVLSSLKNKIDNLYIYSCVAKNGDLVPKFSPILSRKSHIYENSSATNFKINNGISLLNKFKKENKIKICEYFIEENESAIDEITAADYIIRGMIKGGNLECSATLKLSRNYDYINEEKNIYELFTKNNIRWTTLNLPYNRKMLDLYIIDADSNINKFDNIEEVTIEIDEVFAEKLKLEYVPLWNVRFETVNNNMNPRPKPINDKILWQYEIRGINEGSFFIYTKEGSIISQKTCEDGKVEILSDSRAIKTWKLCRLMVVEESKEGIFSNKIKEKFVNMLNGIYNNKIRTLAELERILNSFESLSGLEIENVEIKEKTEEGFSGNCNWFIKDDFKIISNSIMIITFKSNKKTPFIENLVDFYLSQLSLNLTEYIIKGVIVYE